MNPFYLLRPFLFQASPEQAHALSIEALKWGAVPTCRLKADARLNVQIGDLNFVNPVGLAAGYDKNGEVPDAILRLGFGFCEVGTITPRQQDGNPKPRVFRLESDEGVINRLGFNNQGHTRVLERLEARRNKDGIVGVNIGANKDSEDFVADYEAGIDVFYDIASYFTANISSPNTPGLRNLQAREALSVLLNRIFERVDQNAQRSRRKVPVFLKIAPDISEAEMDDIAHVVSESALSGLIVSNTTLDREGLSSPRHTQEAGGLSGKPVYQKSTRILAQMFERIGDKIPLIGVGGISSTEDAVGKIEAGATLLQLYTGLVYHGSTLASEIVNGLSRHLERRSIAHVSDLVGTRFKDWL